MVKQRINKTQSVKKAISTRLRLGATTPIGNATFTAIIWTAETWDTDNFHSSANNARVYIPYSGHYNAILHLMWSGTTAWGSGRVLINIRRNGGNYTEVFDGTVGGSTEPTISIPIAVDGTAGDYFDIEIYQASGAMKELDAASSLTFTYEGEIA